MVNKCYLVASLIFRYLWILGQLPDIDFFKQKLSLLTLIAHT